MERQTCLGDTDGPRVLTEATVEEGSTPTVRKRQLAMELARLRRQAGKSQLEAGKYIGVSDTQMSKFENAARIPKVGYVRSLCELYGVDADHREFLVHLAEDAEQREWWAQFGSAVPTWYQNLLGLETAADQIDAYTSELVHGLLQIPEYVMGIADSASRDEIDRIIEIRSTRQRRLMDGSLRLRVIINEAVLRRDLGGRDSMRLQLRHLVEVAELPNITLQLLPFAVGFHPAMASSFSLFRFSQTPAMDAVVVDIKGGVIFLEQRPDVERFVVDFTRLSAEFAVDESTTKRMLRAELEER